jgi:multiple sugar transport system ATP-binding protein
MADVRFEHVYKRYGDNPPVITDLNLKVNDEEFLVLVGPSGCGKSTALRMIAGLEEISEGNLFIGPKRVNNDAPKDRDIAMVFQNYALYPHMNVYDNMAFSLKLRHMPKDEIERRVKRAAGMLGISEYLSRKPKELSGGQRQRVALGRALVREPQVFLMDEPLSNLDAKLRVQTRAEIAKVHQSVKVTTVYVTHDQIEAMTMGDRIAVLNGGLIQQLGTPQELYDRPANLFVAGFIGSPSMNFFNARLVRTGEGEAEISIGTGAEASTILLSGESARALAGHATADGREVIVGIRPEDMQVASPGDTGVISGQVEIVEHLGNEQLIYIRIPGAMVPEQAESGGTTARISPDVRVNTGQRITFKPDTSKIHIFDVATTKRFA